VRPFRAPHHTTSGIALVGGSSPPRPGEISLAHHGVLFLDELPEFPRHVLEVLREPLESRRISISRAARQAEFPADFQLIAAMNPCPCGFRGHHTAKCSCTADAVKRYRARISGPLLDRIDLHVTVPPLPVEDMGREPGECSSKVRARVEAARQRQLERQGCSNTQLKSHEVDARCAFDDGARKFMRQAAMEGKLSARGHHRVMKVARTIADVQGSLAVTSDHVAEALRYRQEASAV
jgi:magnesium chelatase family protein